MNDPRMKPYDLTNQVKGDRLEMADHIGITGFRVAISYGLWAHRWMVHYATHKKPNYGCYFLCDHSGDCSYYGEASPEIEAALARGDKETAYRLVEQEYERWLQEHK